MAEEYEVREFFERNLPLAAKVGGAVVGISVGLAAGVPWLGTISSPFVAHTLERAGKELIERRLAPRQQVRVTRAIAIASGKARQRLDAGESPRDDAFFADVDGSGRCHADEITEAALMAAMNSAEERKVDFIASLMAALVFRSDIDVATSHLLYLAEQTTYRGLVLLRIISENEPGRFISRGSGDVMPFAKELTALAVEVAELISRGLVSMRDAPEAQDSYLFSGHEMVDPSLLYLTAVGRLMYDLTDLKDMPSESVTYSETFEELQRLSQAAPRTTVIDGGKA